MRECKMHFKLDNVSKAFGGVKAVRDLSFNIDGPELVGLIGPNGAGKTTTVNLINGLLKPDSGIISLNNGILNGLPPYKIVKHGIARTFQVTRVFKRMSVLENLLIPGLTSGPPTKGEVRHVDRAVDILKFLRLDDLKDLKAQNLSGGQQKLLELGRVLMLKPALIVLDEPFAGVHPELKKDLHEHVKSIHSQGKSIILISHDMASVFDLCQRIIVLSNGQKIADGEPNNIRNNDDVVEAYLGE
jgi:branched-chain amino acid transport system ATP-binding protein